MRQAARTLWSNVFMAVRLIQKANQVISSPGPTSDLGTVPRLTRTGQTSTQLLTIHQPCDKATNTHLLTQNRSTRGEQ